MSSLGIFDKETNTYKKVADLSKPAVIDTSMSDTSTNPVQNKVVKNYVDGTFKQKLIAMMPGDGETGYCQLCTIKINETYINCPIEITVQERGRVTLDRLTVLFESTDNIDPNLISFKVFGEFDDWHISKIAASTWVIYGAKSEPWGSIKVVDYIGYNGVNVTWDVTGVTSLPDSKTKAVWGGNVSNAVSADRAIAIADYGDTSRTISIGYAGQGISGDQISYIAGYTDDGKKIKDVSKDALIEWIGLGSAVDTLQGEIDNLKKSVSDGKTTVANAITAKGVTTATDATFATMANNISQITTGVDTSDATATDAQILTGQTAYVKGSKVTGTMANRGAVSQALNAGGSYTIPAGYHNGSGKVTANSLASQTSANATAADIASGKTAWVNGNKITGTMSPGKKYAYGSCSGIPNTTVTVRNYPSILASINTGIKGVSPELVVVQLNNLSLYFIDYLGAAYDNGLFNSTIAITDKGSNKTINPTQNDTRDARFTIDPVYNSNTGLITLNTSVYFELGFIDGAYLDRYNIRYYANSLDWYLIY